MITCAPASASAWTQARPMARPPPVTSAVRPFRSYFSRYIQCPRAFGGSGRERMARQHAERTPVGTEEVAGGRIGGEPDAVMPPCGVIPARLHDEQFLGRDLHVEEGLPAEPLDHHDLAAENPLAPGRSAHRQML